MKVLTLASKLDCARSSFYWYFKNRSELLEALIDHWANTNTRALIEAASQPADTVLYALGNLYASWVKRDKFDTKLDLAMREWARKSKRYAVRWMSTKVRGLRRLLPCFAGYDYPFSESGCAGAHRLFHPDRLCHEGR